jgi:hypothetical protein
MHVIASFEQSFHLELCINELEHKGINKNNIFVVPLVPKTGQKNIFDTIHRSDGMTFIDAPAILGTFLAVIGASYGYKLEWGPIIWGLIGAATGFIIGFIFKLIINMKKLKRKKWSGKTTEVFVIVDCYESQSEKVVETMYEYLAIGVATVKQN